MERNAYITDSYAGAPSSIPGMDTDSYKFFRKRLETAGTVLEHYTR